MPDRSCRSLFSFDPAAVLAWRSDGLPAFCRAAPTAQVVPMGDVQPLIDGLRIRAARRAEHRLPAGQPQSQAGHEPDRSRLGGPLAPTVAETRW